MQVTDQEDSLYVIPCKIEILLDLNQDIEELLVLLAWPLRIQVLINYLIIKCIYIEVLL